ncbi:transmembrane protein 53-A-like [Ctenocephalides felis]|uniref:transmembrane protein 53-A-like n=1 Tax=Ctenocephalides felis TaxID=7515 RepID=UPI000E6E3519|nr:transmembrane protein 53-A-like [Ctenocephalides felis]
MPVLLRVSARFLKHTDAVKYTTQHRCLSAFSKNTDFLLPVKNVSVFQRDLSSQEVTKNIQLFSNDKVQIDKDLKLEQPLERPLVVLLTWLMAKQKHIMKFADIYNDHGFDVLNVSINPWQLLWPAKGTQLVSRDVLKFLYHNTTYNPVLLHGFSVGGYVWGECLVHISQNPKLYNPLLQRIAGQIWDSAADITEIPIGTPKAVFPKNKVLQTALRKYMIYHLKTFHDVATSHYIRASQMFHSTLVRSPALFLLSKTDPIGPVSSNQRVKEAWEGLGIKCYWKCWDRSPHVGHFHKHPKEYTQELNSFLESIGLINEAQKMRAQMQN